jgi:hypothetical protein
MRIDFLDGLQTALFAARADAGLHAHGALILRCGRLVLVCLRRLLAFLRR